MTTLLLRLLLFLPVLFAGERKEAGQRPSVREYTGHLEVDGNPRSFLVVLPDQYSPDSLALVFVLHGGSGTAAGMERLTSFKAIAASESFALIYPQGIDRSWNDGRPTAAHEKAIDDVRFFSRMMDYMEARYPVSRRKIYIAGISNGGFMTSRLAMELSGRVAACAVVAATIDSGAAAPKQIQPVSMMYIHGTSDPLVPFEGGHTRIGPAKQGAFLSHQQAIDTWVAIDHCNPVPIVTALPDIHHDGTTVTRYEYKEGLQGTTVVGYTIQNGGHTWPGGWQYLPAFLVGKTCRDFDASQTIWDFFRSHPRP